MALEEPAELKGPILDQDGIPTFVEPPLQGYLRGMTIDYPGGVWGDGFVVSARGAVEQNNSCH